MKKRSLSLITLLTGLVVASVMCTLIVQLVVSYESQKESLKKTTLSLNYSNADKISRTVDSLFKSMRTSLRTTKDFLAHKEGLTDQEIQEYFELIRSSNLYFNSLLWVDKNGLVRNISPISVGLKGTTITTGATKAALDSKRPSLSPPYIGPTGRLLVHMSEPLYDNAGTYRGNIGGTIYLQENNVLNDILGYNTIDENGSYFYVVGTDGTLLFHPQKDRIGEDVSRNPVVKSLMQGKNGIDEVTNTKGVPMLAAYSIIPETGWGIVQQTPVSSVQQLLISSIEKLILYSLPPFLILLILSIFFARRLALPFVSLAKRMNQLSSGKEVSLPEIHSNWFREAELLSKSVTIAIQAVQNNNKQLIRVATSDPLTGLDNRRVLTETMEKWSIGENVFSLVVLDIDHFKAVNDTYGHQNGDEVLKYLSSLITSNVRSTDKCFRYGGEEFVLALPHTTAAEAYLIAEKLRKTIEHTMSPIGKPITVSFGISEFPKHSQTPDELFSLADKALYYSKQQGRNRTTIASLPLQHDL